MAAAISEAQAELVRSLAPDDIPIKLRCAICSKLAVSAFRLPCCEQAICEDCQANLPSSCPVCEHSPLSAEDCSPNKSLRTTIRVFLRTEEKKREASRPKVIEDIASETQTVAAKATAPSAGQSAAEQSAKSSAPAAGDGGIGSSDSAQAPQHGLAKSVIGETAQDVLLAGSESSEKNQAEAQAQNAEERDDERNDSKSGEQALEQMASGGQANHDQHGGIIGTEDMHSNFSGMNFHGSGDVNQMQMMMAMQSGLEPNSFGGFPMMGMPGMAIDPMMMQSMYMNGGFQGMGMNGMGSFGGGFGQGSNDIWNGSQSWSFDQNNYNQSGPGMGTGDFGNFNSGFQTGYNEGNYGPQLNDFRRGIYGRGRGRGRARGFYGSYGRGGWHTGGGAGAHHFDQGQRLQHGLTPAHAQGQNVGDHQGEPGSGKEADQHGREVASQTGVTTDQKKGQGEGDGGISKSNADPDGIATRDTISNDAPPAAAVPPRGPRNGIGNVPIRSVLPAPDVPLNAPRGPKAMRQGLPNTSLHNLRARGFHVEDSVSPSVKPSAETQATQTPVSTPAAPRASRSMSPSHERHRKGDSHHEGSASRSRERGQRERATSSEERGRKRGRSGSDLRVSSRSPSGSRSTGRRNRSSHRRRRHHSESVGVGVESEEGHRHKRHRSRRQPDSESEYSRPREGKHSRSVSPSDSRRSGHRGHRDRETVKQGAPDRDRRDEEERKKPSRRSRREKERRRDRERRERRERRRGRGRDRDRRGGDSSRKLSVDGRSTPAEKEATKPPTGPRGFDIKGASGRPSAGDGPDRCRRSSQTLATDGGGSKPQPAKDAHQLEREARNRERLLKEAQRMAGLAGLSGAKREREDGDDGGNGRKGRRTNRRSETVDVADGEERMKRLEAEREGGRWG